jgi:hypothetical protein
MTTENVFFLGVGRVSAQAVILASYQNVETDLDGVKQVLMQPNQMSIGKHYSFTTGATAWHLIKGMIFIV